MANPIPCGICGEVEDADLLVTDRTPGCVLLGVPTQGMCVRCFIETGSRVAEAIVEAMNADPAPEPAGPGVLEQITADEAADDAAEGKRPARKTPKIETEAEQQATTETAEVAHVSE